MPSPDCSRELGTFAAIPRKENCSHCQRETLAIGPDRFVEAIYCISLKEQPERTERAIAHFHDIGLCTAVTLYQPRRGHHLPTAIWQSHRAVAAEALRHGFRRTLFLEDDAFFGEPWDKAQARIERAAAGLPSDWWGLYLGHWPIQGYFIRRDLMRVRSGCTHAYIANEALLQWLADTVPMNPSVPVCSAIGTSIDAALDSAIHGRSPNKPGPERNWPAPRAPRPKPLS